MQPVLVKTTAICLLAEIRLRFATFCTRSVFFRKLAAEKQRCKNHVIWRTVATKTNKIGHYCDCHIPSIAILPDMHRYDFECGIENHLTNQSQLSSDTSLGFAQGGGGRRFVEESG